MKYKTKRRIRRISFIAVIALALCAALAYVIFRAINPATPVNKRTIELPAASGNDIFGWESGFLCINGRILTCVDTSGGQIWQIELPDIGMKAARAYGLTVAWKGKQYILIDNTGAVIATRELTTDILMICCGGSGVAILTQEEDQHRLWVYGLNGEIVDDARFPYLSVLAMEYYGDGGKQLWVLVLDSHGTIPVSWYRSYHPGKSTTGAITLNGQVAYSALPTDKEIFIVGTHNLIGHKTTNEEDYNKLIYGWSLQDQLADDQVRFLFAPSNTGQQDAALSALWYISIGGEEYRIPLPSGCFRALLGGEGLVAVTREGVYTMKYNGADREFSKLPFLIDRVAAVSPEKAMAVESGGTVYLVPLT